MPRPGRPKKLLIYELLGPPLSVFVASLSKGTGSAFEAQKGSQFTCFLGLHGNFTLRRVSFQALARLWRRQKARNLHAFWASVKNASLN